MKDGHIHTPYCPHGTNDTFDDYVKKSIEEIGRASCRERV